VSAFGWSPGGAAIGAGVGIGLLLMLWGAPWWRRPTLEDRITPYLPEVTSSRLLDQPRGRSPFGPLERLLAPVMSDAARFIDRLTGGPGTIRSRLDTLGRSTTLEQFRAEQVIWGVLGAIGGVAFALAGVVGRGTGPVLSIVTVVLGAALGVVGRDRYLSVQVQRRQERMLAEFPTVAELLALSVGAGEGAVGALDRVARTCHGDLAAELRRTLADARAGATLVQALEGLARRTALPNLARFVDGVAIAVERGTPLADVLRAQAQDVREESRRRLMEAGGKKEIAMMIPVVFLILPVTVLFVAYPGLAALSLSL